jgi:hypothetical protein
MPPRGRARPWRKDTGCHDPWASPDGRRNEPDLFSSGEAAQEWSFLRGSLFTHHLLAALRGAADIDGDGRVSLSEAYTHAFRHTTIGAIESNGGPSTPAST